MPTTSRIATFLLRAWSMRALAALALVAAVTACTPAAAQVAPNVSFDVVPALAAAGMPRQVSVTLPWPMDCALQASVVTTDAIRTRTVTIVLDDTLPTAIFCDVIVQRRATVTVTPSAEGDLRVQAVTRSGKFIAETTVRTRAPDSNRSQYDLTGMWFDPATAGSGLTFVHAATGSDSVFGTWYVYDRQGAPRWYTIQGFQWSAGGMVAQGQLYETRADSILCMPPFVGCPIALATVGGVGVVTITLNGPNSARIQATSPAGGVITSDIIRSIF